MANVLFKLRGKGGKSDMASINLVYCLNHDERLVYPTGLKVQSIYWDKKMRKVKQMAAAKDKDTINKQLNFISEEVSEWLTKEKVARREPTKESLRAFLDTLLKPKKAEEEAKKVKEEEDKKVIVDSFVSDFIDNAYKRTDSRTGRKIGKATLYAYERAFKYLKEFEQKQGEQLQFSDIGLMFYQDYTAFLQGKGLSVNSCGREIKTLKIFFNDAAIKGIDINKEYFKKGVFKITKEDADNIALTKEELQRLYSLNLDNDPTLDRVRDVFLVGCYTGLRYSDYSKLSDKLIHGNTIHLMHQTTINLRMKKTDGDVVIPLHPIVKAILEKFGGTLPKSRRTGKPVTSQKFNKYLHKVCNTIAADGRPCIYGTETKRITKGGVRVDLTLNRADMVSSHTARRTFATINYLNGMAATDLMRITGHKTEAAFRKYVKVTNEQAAQKMFEVWQRNGELMHVSK